MKKTECPKCLGTKQNIENRKPTTCKLCDEEGKVDDTVYDGFTNKLGYGQY